MMSTIHLARNVWWHSSEIHCQEIIIKELGCKDLTFISIAIVTHLLTLNHIYHDCNYSNIRLRSDCKQFWSLSDSIILYRTQSSANSLNDEEIPTLISLYIGPRTVPCGIYTRFNFDIVGWVTIQNYTLGSLHQPDG